MTTSNAQAALDDAMACHQQGNHYDAERHYLRALQIEPDNAQALRLRAILARDRGDMALALRLLDHAAAVAPTDSEVLAEAGLSKMMCGDLQAGEYDLRAARELTPNSTDLLTNLGALLQHRGHQHEAIEIYRGILQQDETEIEIRCNLAKALADCGRHDDAQAEAERAVQLSNGERGSLATQGAVLIDAGNLTAARDVLLQAVERQPDDMALVNLALCCAALDGAQAATGYLIRAVELNPHNARAVADLVDNLGATGDSAAAIALAEGFLHEHPAERLVLGAYAQALLNAGNTPAANALLDCDSLVQVFDLSPPDEFADMSAFNSALKSELLSDPTRILNPVSKATTGGEQTGELNLSDSAAKQSFAALMNAAIGEAVATLQARGLAQHPVLQPGSDNWSLRAWGTVIQSGGQQAPHMHPLGWLSAVYYVSVPPGMDDGHEAGYLEFGAPPERFYCKDKPATRRFAPREGRLVIFPSWFWHRTLPHSATDPRISLAFDVMPLNKLSPLG